MYNKQYLASYHPPPLPALLYEVLICSPEEAEIPETSTTPYSFC